MELLTRFNIAETGLSHAHFLNAEHDFVAYRRYDFVPIRPMPSQSE
jgi:hypothetical protein